MIIIFKLTIISIFLSFRNLGCSVRRPSKKPQAERAESAERDGFRPGQQRCALAGGTLLSHSYGGWQREIPHQLIGGKTSHYL